MAYETPLTLQSVRTYVRDGAGTGDGTGRSPHTVLLHVEHSNLKNTRLFELRLDLRDSVDALKQRLYRHTGTRPAHMRLFAPDPSTGDGRAELRDDDATLGEAGLRTGDTVLLVDDDPHSVSVGGWLEDTSLVQKYELSDAAYDKKENTYRRFRARMREKDPNWSMTSALARQANARNAASSANAPNAPDVHAEQPSVRVGDRVEVFPGAKRGEVRFVGAKLHELPPGWWLGVVYDEPVGKNDGSIKGVRYFQADPNHGGLVRASNVTVGDFPPLSLDDDSDIEL